MFRWTARHLASVLLSCLMLGAPTAGASSFTSEQRAEIIGILREALRSDPSILREALEALRTSYRTRQDEAAHAAIALKRDSLLADPADPVAPAGHLADPGAGREDSWALAAETSTAAAASSARIATAPISPASSARTSRPARRSKSWKRNRRSPRSDRTQDRLSLHFEERLSCLHDCRSLPVYY